MKLLRIKGVLEIKPDGSKESTMNFSPYEAAHTRLAELRKQAAKARDRRRHA
ncbi:hypothetical protein GCM10009839_05800 [Catenulispora yoronensis]|uniref:Uncharacterized protein n=1 Tax=Catenulispora yoronensis TaxID=450799 RepID=A0ABN2TM29_9ACTN